MDHFYISRRLNIQRINYHSTLWTRSNYISYSCKEWYRSCISIAKAFIFGQKERIPDCWPSIKFLEYIICSFHQVHIKKAIFSCLRAYLSLITDLRFMRDQQIYQKGMEIITHHLCICLTKLSLHILRVLSVPNQ